MIRRTFRRGIRLGALAGIAYGVAKVLQSRRDQTATPAPWQPEPLPAPAPLPAPVRTAPTPPPTEAAAPPEPEAEPEPEPEPEAAPAPSAAVTAEAEPAPPAPPPPPAPRSAASKDDFNLAPDRPARPGAASRETAKRAAVKRTSSKTSVAARAWVEPSGSTCPPSHPIKAKKPSFLYHLPGMAAYERTKPDRCYRDERSARGDGFLKAKR